MYRLFALVSIPALVIAAVIQQPLHDSHHQASLISNSKELVNSNTLEAHITKESLLKRAKALSKIADEGIQEYNHPTRVVGSKGSLPKLDSFPFLC
jgi:aminopeptidase Y